MQSTEYQLPIQEFSGAEPRGVLTKELAMWLKESARSMADVYREVSDPPVWYREVYKGSFKDAKSLGKFKAEFNKRAEENPALKDPYTYIDKNWESHSVVTLPSVHQTLERVSSEILSVAKWLKGKTSGEMGIKFTEYLETTAKCLVEGKFDEGQKAFLELPTRIRVSFLASLVEYYDDPLGVKASPEAAVMAVDPELTIQANEAVGLYRKVYLDRFGYQPIYSKAFVAQMRLCSGWLGVGDRRVSAFNLPNDPKISNEVGNTVIYIFPARIAEKNDNVLAPKLKELCGVASKANEAEAFAFAHEVAHGERPEGEARRLGPLRSTVREGWANRRAILLSAHGLFTDDHTERVIRGHLAYGADDLGDLSKVVFDPLGRNQPSLAEILKKDPYTFDSYILWRIGFFRGAFNRSKGTVDYDKIIRLAEEVDPIYAELARYGTEDSARRAFEGMIDKKRNFFVPLVLKEIFHLGKAVGNQVF